MGGLISPPFKLDLGAFQTLPGNLCWGCLGETMLLTLAREEGNFSIGGRIPLAQADRLSELAEIHGFEPSAPQWYRREITASQLNAFAEHVQDRALQAVATSFEDHSAITKIRKH